ncbi:transmembrane protein 158 [Hemicordylus capensis]|uniref:transmembrane protein 158 n=1 Tax=Hemicordylus capensis TaxID=884348 RepID=UPI00230412FA|nr:transmembrane protein 158 [Hemicordylus capensis]
MLLPLLPALLAAFAPPHPCRGWSPSAASDSGQEEPPELTLPPMNFSASSAAAPKPLATGGALAADFHEGREGATEAAAAEAGDPRATTSAAPAAAAPSPEPPRPAPQQQHPREEPPCNISVQRQMLSSLLVRWSPLGFQCDLVLFSTSGPGGRAFFSAAFHRVGPPPLLIEHVGLAAGGVQQDLRLCVGCSWARGRRVGRLRPGGSNPPSSSSPSSAALFSSSSLPTADHGQSWQQGERLHFCCLDFSLEELKGDPGWRMNRKPIESTLVACFMTLVIIVWSVAALIWPVPIIAGFLPNGMEQRRNVATTGSTSGAATAAK